MAIGPGPRLLVVEKLSKEELLEAEAESLFNASKIPATKPEKRF